VAIAIPNLLNAIQRAKQRRTMGDMRSIATAIESYATDYNSYPPAAAQAVTWSAGTPATVGSKLGTYIAPTYIKVLPMTDGWNSWLEYATGNNQANYYLQSGGRDGKFEAITVDAGQTTDFNNDIIFVDGQFVRYPEGAQKN
jgi:general secretion pathway protein G